MSETKVIESTRQTTTFKTPNGHEIVAYSYLTGRDERALQAVYYEDFEITAADVKAGKAEERSKISGLMMNRMHDVEIEQIVVSVDGKTENILDLVLDLRKEDYLAVREHINVVTGKKELLASETTSLDTSTAESSEGT